jgi:hypothetical protein
MTLPNTGVNNVATLAMETVEAQAAIRPPDIVLAHAAMLLNGGASNVATPAMETVASLDATRLLATALRHSLNNLGSS